jgi:DNA-binding NtrC family response regulator
MDDPRRYFGLHTITMLRDLIRKWWQVDIGFVDASGQLLDQVWGDVPPAGNDFCRAMLSSTSGSRRCLSSIREIHRRLRRELSVQGTVSHSCHLGLQMVASPVHAQERYRGFVFACGFSSRELSRTRVTRLRGTLSEFLSKKSSLEGERIPVLGREDTERLKDLLAYGSREMAAFEQELSRRESVEVAETQVAFEGIIDGSPAMAEMLGHLKKLALQPCPILLVGEAGTGKRELARAVHLSSPRRRAPFRELDGSPDPSAAESKLFGQVRGGGLGRTGTLDSARGGTVYLSSGSWLVLPVQLKLLRLLQEDTFVPVGANRPVEADVRLVFGLEGDFDSEIGQAHLRRDLADWLAPYLVKIPPLRERKEDLGSLADLFIRRYALAGHPLPVLHPDTLTLLQRYQWPGNATELEEEIRNLIRLSGRGGPLVTSAVSLHIRENVGDGSRALTNALKGTKNLKEAIELLERELIHEGLVRTRWNKSLLARQLGISRSNLLAKLDKYGLGKRSSLES